MLEDKFETIYVGENVSHANGVCRAWKQRGVWSGIRFKGTPEGDGNFHNQFSQHANSELDLKVLRKGTETATCFCSSNVISSIRFKGTPEGDGNLPDNQIVQPWNRKLDLKVLRKGTETNLKMLKVPRYTLLDLKVLRKGTETLSENLFDNSLLLDLKVLRKGTETCPEPSQEIILYRLDLKVLRKGTETFK